MRLSMMVSALVVWPMAAFRSFRARRRLRASAWPTGNGRLTLTRVA
jgi:hypothetical protein